MPNCYDGQREEEIGDYQKAKAFTGDTKRAITSYYTQPEQQEIAEAASRQAVSLSGSVANAALASRNTLSAGNHRPAA